MSDDVYLGELEQMVLWAILRFDGEAYGTPILDVLEARAERAVTPGALYATIDRLEEKGVIESRLADPEPGRGGRRKRYLSVTPAGQEALRRARSKWMRLWEGLGDAVEG
ncbi:MAG: PadR family transcriptional regulator [Longimicrobiales bacterium]|nr:PadR family transcriptional regulator [Longimicrobiales bacterium]